MLSICLFCMHTNMFTHLHKTKGGFVDSSSALQTQTENISIVRKAWELPLWIERISQDWHRIAEIPSIIAIPGSLSTRLPFHAACSIMGDRAWQREERAESHLWGTGELSCGLVCYRSSFVYYWLNLQTNKQEQFCLRIKLYWEKVIQLGEWFYKKHLWYFENE